MVVSKSTAQQTNEQKRLYVSRNHWDSWNILSLEKLSYCELCIKLANLYMRQEIKKKSKICEMCLNLPVCTYVNFDFLDIQLNIAT